VATRRPDANPSTLVPAFDDRALAAASCSLAVDRVPADAAASDPRALGWMRGFPSGRAAPSVAEYLMARDAAAGPAG